MMPTTSCIGCSFGSTTATRLPSRWMWMRSAISNTCGMLWLIRITGRPLSRTSLDQLEHLPGLLDAERGGRLVHDHELARPRRGAGHRRRPGAGRRTASPPPGSSERMPICRLFICRRGLLVHGPCGRACGTRRRADPRRASRPRNRLVAMSSAGRPRGPGRPSRCRRAGVVGVVEVPDLAVEPDLALVGDGGAREHLDHARLAGPVVPDHGEDLAG